MQKRQNQHPTRYLETGTKCHTPTLRHRPYTWTPRVRMHIFHTCARTLNFAMYITHVVSVCTFIHATPVLKFCTV